MSDNVERPFELSTKRGTLCGHWQPVVCESERSVSCKACGAPLDPITVLVRMAKHRERLMFEGQHLRTEINRLAERVDELKREERNLKSRARRRSAKALEPEATPENVVPLYRGKARS